MPIYGFSNQEDGFLTIGADQSRSVSLYGLDTVRFDKSEFEIEPNLYRRAEHGNSFIEIWEGVSDVNGKLHYTNFGAFIQNTSTQSLFLPWYSGIQTPLARIPTQGWAAYAGVTKGILVEPAGAFEVLGNVLLSARFNAPAPRISGELYDLVAFDADPNIPHYRFRVDLDQGDIGHLPQGARHFSGAAHGNLPGNVATGEWGGRFFGPSAEEVAGDWIIQTNDNSIWAAGSFGARTESSQHPSGPWETRTTVGSIGDSLPLKTSAALVQFASDGTVTSMTAFSAPTAQMRRDNNSLLARVTYSTPSGTRSVSETTPNLIEYPVNEAMTRGQYLSPSGLANLSYHEYGYWTDNLDSPGSQSRWYFFHAGSETPLANMPTGGTANYSGNLVGAMAYLQYSIDGKTMRQIDGTLRMTMDFGAKTLKGKTEGLGFNEFKKQYTGVGGLPFNLQFTGSISGNGFSGTTAIVDQDPARLSSGNGGFSGKFYGPDAREAAGLWNIASSDGKLKAQGAFGVRKDINR